MKNYFGWKEKGAGADIAREGWEVRADLNTLPSCEERG